MFLVSNFLRGLEAATNAPTNSRHEEMNWPTSSPSLLVLPVYSSAPKRTTSTSTWTFVVTLAVFLAVFNHLAGKRWRQEVCGGVYRTATTAAINMLMRRSSYCVCRCLWWKLIFGGIFEDGRKSGVVVVVHHISVGSSSFRRVVRQQYRRFVSS